MIRHLAACLLVLAVPVAAQEPEDSVRIGDDVFMAGGSAVLQAAGADDVFAAAERVDIAAPVGGSALLAGRRVTTDAAVGGDLYAFGADVTVAAPVGGDATLAGYDVNVTAEVGADLRASGRHVRVAAPVAGSALLAGATVHIDAAIAGDAEVTAGELSFGPGGRVGGRLTLHEDRPQPVPESAVPPDRIERVPADPHEFDRVGAPRLGWLALGSGFLIGVVVVAALGVIVASIAPEGLDGLRRVAGARPFRTFWVGFFTLAALIGAAVIATLSIVGIVAAPLLLALALALALLGYVIGVYLVGLAAWDRLGQLAPDSFPERALAALIGAALVGLVALVPFLGWLVLLALSLTGLGALCAAWLRPEIRP